MTADLTVAQELFDLVPERVDCPYPAFATLREQAPVEWFDTAKAYVVTRYDLILEVLRQPNLFSSQQATGPETDREMAELMIEMVGEDPEFAISAQRAMEGASVPVLLRADPPDHSRQRALVNRAFTAPAIRRIEPDIQQIADDLIDTFIDRGRVELLTDFAIPFPMTVIAKALGVSLDRMDDFIRWSATLVAGVGKRGFTKPMLAGIMRAQEELGAYLLSVIDEREREPKDDVITRLVEATIDGERLTRQEMVSMIVQFLLAGNHTTATIIATAMLRLVNEPELADKLRAEPDLMADFVEEMLRLEPPVNGIYRTATADYTLGGVDIPAGSTLWLVYAAGNRDPEPFPNPDTLVCPQPSTSQHLTFGLGEHHCLGSALARAETRIGLSALLARCADFRLDADPADIHYEENFMLHCLAELPLTFSDAAAAPK